MFVSYIFFSMGLMNVGLVVRHFISRVGNCKSNPYSCWLTNEVPPNDEAESYKRFETVLARLSEQRWTCSLYSIPR